MADKSPLCTKIIHQLNSTYANQAPHTKCGLIDFFLTEATAPWSKEVGAGLGSHAAATDRLSPNHSGPLLYFPTAWERGLSAKLS